jgi:hypothetical protein
VCICVCLILSLLLSVRVNIGVHLCVHVHLKGIFYFVCVKVGVNVIVGDCVCCSVQVCEYVQVCVTECVWIGV